MIAIIGLTLLSGALFFRIWQSEQDITQQTEDINIGGDFSLTDHNETRVSARDFYGHYTLIYFGFSFCPDVCPTALSRLSLALDTLDEKQAEKIQPLFISLDYERDTPSVLRDYVSHFHPRLIGLTGSADDLAKTKRAFRVYGARVDDPSSAAGYTIDHSSVIYFMDQQGKFLAFFSEADSADVIAKKIARELARLIDS